MAKSVRFTKEGVKKSTTNQIFGLEKNENVRLSISGAPKFEKMVGVRSSRFYIAPHVDVEDFAEGPGMG